jgi:hypothetical protein
MPRGLIYSRLSSNRRTASALAEAIEKCHTPDVKYESYESTSNWDRFFAIPASGVVFASGAAMIGAAMAGPVGGIVGATLGAVGGIATEIVSQKHHKEGE